MTISVLVAAFNCQDTIKIAIDSVLQQTLMPSEIIVFDDCSNDNTTSIVEAYSNVKLIRGKINRGPGYVRKMLVNASSSEFCVFLDSDDIMDVRRLERIAEFAVNCEFRSFLLYHDRLSINDKNIETTIKAPRLKEFDFAKHWYYLLGGLYGISHLNGSTATCTLSAYRSWLLAIGNFDSRFRLAEDTDLAIKNSLSWGKVFVIDEALIKQRLLNKAYKNKKKELYYQTKLVLKYNSYLPRKKLIRTHHWNKLKYSNSIHSLFFLLFSSPLYLISKFYLVSKSGNVYYRSIWR